MADTYVVGVDGSDNSRRAALVARSRAEASGARLVVVFVIEWSPYTFNTHEENEARHREKTNEIERAQSKVMDPLLEELSAGSAIEIEAVVRHGHEARVLIDIVGETGASELFISRVGRSDSLVFGSVASHLLQTSPVPVTVVP